MKKIIIITGLTASGKSGLALNIAKDYDGEIISCDSVQVYTGLDIGSAKESIENRNIIRHHLIDIVEPTHNYSVGEFLTDCKSAILDCINRNKLPIIVGGTGLYVKALLEGYTLGVVRNQEFREKWEKYAEINGRKAVWEELNKLDIDKASKVHYNNIHRVIRYLELATYGEPQKEKSILADYDVLAIGINEDKDKIYSKIDARVDEMVKDGLEAEVRSLINHGVNLTYNSFNTIGYKEMYEYITNQISYDECVRLIKQHTRNYAKRQLTFMKIIDGLKILTKEDAKNLIHSFMKK